jgi:1-acyl-sn-glycerol-3-phosphate acyltransferase
MKYGKIIEIKSNRGAFMIRTIIWYLYFWTYMLCTIPALMRAKRLERENNIEEKDKLVYQIARNWAKSLVELSGSTVEVKGQENIPDGPVLFVSNHQSAFDIPILIGYIDKPKAFIAKAEIRKMPIVGAWMEVMQCIFMNRKSIRQSLQAINKGAECLKKGYSLVIFPEGTRSKDGLLREFKPGSFKLAMKSRVPIVPITIRNSFKIQEKSSFMITPAKVEVIISQPVFIADIGEDGTVIADHIQELVRQKL